MHHNIIPVELNHDKKTVVTFMYCCWALGMWRGRKLYFFIASSSG
ncbi:hypothetical protein C942_03607 [Photobacterium marinum]|uniref:Uncharacterized protein n=1 Tax=Photobacterium marinum TaxID=1056511 RepID=L8J3Z6_9GAMM|nr:hypothetical protein C942_03607 [Photobacterium marinum]